MIGRLVHKADFERLLASRARTRSAHFAVHHVPLRCLMRTSVPPEVAQQHLSTGLAPEQAQTVDNTAATISIRLGCVVPKRHARRAVTRNLLKRQMRAAFGRHVGRLDQGDWLLRLSNGFPLAQFASAASSALAQAARRELDDLLMRSVR